MSERGIDRPVPHEPAGLIAVVGITADSFRSRSSVGLYSFNLYIGRTVAKASAYNGRNG